MRISNKTEGLFKYLNSDKLADFEDCLVSLTPPKYLNDPWDFLIKGSVPSPEETQKIAQESGMEHHLAELQQDFASKECLSAQGQNYLEEIGQIIGIVSLTEKPLCRLMWAHYGDSHKGFVAEFEATEQREQDGFPIRGCDLGLASAPAAKVRYPDAYFQQLSKDCGNIGDICLSKHPAWTYEEEWRIIFPLHEPPVVRKNERFYLRFAPQALRRLIFGMNMKPEHKQRLCSMLAKEDFKRVQKQRTTINPETGELELLCGVAELVDAPDPLLAV